jgi:predicted AlkP superfamily pyrophosphatase or phosphodiesterase
MHRPVAVILVAGLSESVLGAECPYLAGLAGRGRVTRLTPQLPAVTCTSQAAMVTGLAVREHGIVGNGWYRREDAEARFWAQSHALMSGEKVWEAARRVDPGLRTAVLFWWFNMYSSAEITVTPRPVYTADGRKVPDLHTQPAGLRHELQEALGRFPLLDFWGPKASIGSSLWIARAAKRVLRRHDPGLMLVYLPHLDYSLQRDGPGTEGARRAAGEIDGVVAGLAGALEGAGRRVLIVSEYGIERVDGAVAINRVLRRRGWLRARDELGREALDMGASDAFALADHQVAHVYVRGPGLVPAVAEACAAEEGVERVLDREAQRGLGIDHPRAGDLVLVARAGTWFAYPWWLDDARAPDYARTVDIHRKPGYDPCELFIDPALRLAKARVALRLAQRRLGMRALLDVIPLDASLVRGSHGRSDVAAELRPVLISAADSPARADEAPITSVRDAILGELFGAA